MAEEDRVGKLIRSIERRETVKIRSKERKEELSIFFNEVKHQLKEAIAKYF